MTTGTAGMALESYWLGRMEKAVDDTRQRGNDGGRYRHIKPSFVDLVPQIHNQRQDFNLNFILCILRWLAITISAFAPSFPPSERCSGVWEEKPGYLFPVKHSLEESCQAQQHHDLPQRLQYSPQPLLSILLLLLSCSKSRLLRAALIVDQRRACPETSEPLCTRRSLGYSKTLKSITSILIPSIALILFLVLASASLIDRDQVSGKHPDQSICTADTGSYNSPQQAVLLSLSCRQALRNTASSSKVLRLYIKLANVLRGSIKFSFVSGIASTMSSLHSPNKTISKRLEEAEPSHSDSFDPRHPGTSQNVFQGFNVDATMSSACYPPIPVRSAPRILEPPEDQIRTLQRSRTCVGLNEYSSPDNNRIPFGSTQGDMSRAGSGQPHSMDANPNLSPVPKNIVSKLSKYFRTSSSADTDISPTPRPRHQWAIEDSSNPALSSGVRRIRDPELEAAFRAFGAPMPDYANVLVSPASLSSSVSLEERYGEPPLMQPLLASATNSPVRLATTTSSSDLVAKNQFRFPALINHNSKKGPTQELISESGGRANFKVSSIHPQKSYVEREDHPNPLRSNPVDTSLYKDGIVPPHRSHDRRDHTFETSDELQMSFQREDQSASHNRRGIEERGGGKPPSLSMPRSQTEGNIYGYSGERLARRVSDIQGKALERKSSRKRMSPKNRSTSRRSRAVRSLFNVTEPSLNALNKLKKKTFIDANIDSDDPEAAAKLKTSSRKLPPEAPNPASKEPTFDKIKKGAGGSMIRQSESSNVLGKFGASFENLVLRSAESRPSASSTSEPLQSISEDSPSYSTGRYNNSVNYSRPTSNNHHQLPGSTLNLSSPLRRQNNFSLPDSVTSISKYDHPIRAGDLADIVPDNSSYQRLSRTGSQNKPAYRRVVSSGISTTPSTRRSVSHKQFRRSQTQSDLTRQHRSISMEPSPEDAKESLENALKASSITRLSGEQGTRIIDDTNVSFRGSVSSRQATNDWSDEEDEDDDLSAMRRRLSMITRERQIVAAEVDRMRRERYTQALRRHPSNHSTPQAIPLTSYQNNSTRTSLHDNFTGNGAGNVSMSERVVDSSHGRTPIEASGIAPGQQAGASTFEICSTSRGYLSYVSTRTQPRTFEPSMGAAALTAAARTIQPLSNPRPAELYAEQRRDETQPVPITKKERGMLRRIFGRK